MSEINRSLLVVKPKQPLLDWAHSADLDAGAPLEEVRDDTSAYLIPEFEFRADRMKILAWCLDFVFEEELNAWSIDETTWPKRRDMDTFLEWFDVEFHSIVFDLSPDLPLEYADYDDIEDDENGDEDDEPGSNGQPSSNGH
jgi:hypothetical protein